MAMNSIPILVVFVRLVDKFHQEIWSSLLLLFDQHCLRRHADSAPFATAKGRIQVIVGILVVGENHVSVVLSTSAWNCRIFPGDLF